jgi:segregation and condensation protein A
LSVRERMSAILLRLRGSGYTPFETLFDPHEGRAGLLVTFLALLELVRERLVDIVQNAPFAPIHARLAGNAGAAHGD